MIEPRAQNLMGVFGNNSGFYIPNFQREFSWSRQTAIRLVRDIQTALQIKLQRNQDFHDVFLGTLILLNSNRNEIGDFKDSPAISNSLEIVIDGQQRLTTLTVIGAIISDEAENVIEKLRCIDDNAGETLVAIIERLSEKVERLQTWKSFSVINSRANPKEKPLIIRSYEASERIARDQWTLHGDPDSYYKSDVAVFLQKLIEGVKLNELINNILPQSSLLTNVAKEIKLFFQNYEESFFSEEREDNILKLLIKGYEESEDGENNIKTEIEKLYQMADKKGKAAIKYTLYLYHYLCILLERTKVVVIHTSDVSLAYDMFQSINGTGIPLTTIEVIKPDLVQKFLAKYGIHVQGLIHEMEYEIANLVHAKNGKDKITQELIIDISRSYSGDYSLSKLFSDQRLYLKKIIDQSTNEECLRFLSILKFHLTYKRIFMPPGANPDNMRTHLLHGGGFQWNDADLLSLIMIFLNQSGHTYPHRVLSVFYSNLMISGKKNGITHEITQSSRCHLLQVAKSCAAFFCFWKGFGETRFPDSVYKSLFTNVPNITYSTGSENQNGNFISAEFRRALDQMSQRKLGKNFSKKIWIEALSKTPIYTKSSKVAKLILMIAHHDAQPDFRKGFGGLLRDGPGNSANYLTVDGWTRESNAQIEHIAVQNPNPVLNYPSLHDANIYDQDPQAVNRIGNLTFLSALQNPAVAQEWPDKLFFYWSLTNRGGEGLTSRENLLQKLGIERLPPSLLALCEGANMVHHLAPIVQYGLENGKWSLDQINRRSYNIGERAFDKLWNWLQ